MSASPAEIEAIADRLDAAQAAAALTGLPSADAPALTLADGWAVAHLRCRRLAGRGGVRRGYKIGFTNRGIWPRYGVYAPIWAPVWSHTLTLLDGTAARLDLHGLVQPRLEPEIVFGFVRAPAAGMDDATLAACIDWVAHGFEIVHTHYADWRFAAVDTLIDHALHGRLLVGPRVPASRFADLGAELAALELALARDGVVVDRGRGAAVLDGPLAALRQWLDAMAVQTPEWTVAAGDVVTTGTITDAWPLHPGQRWTTTLTDPRLPGLALDIA